jgi:hypothetical protein
MAGKLRQRASYSTILFLNGDCTFPGGAKPVLIA